MKKLIFFMTFFVASVATLFSQRITLTSPNGGENWALESRKPITWTSTGISGNVKLVLMKGTAIIGNIVQNIPLSSGNFNWTVGGFEGGTASAGSGYVIQIITMDLNYQDKSDRPFTLLSRFILRPSSVSLMPTITVTEPQSSITWLSGSGWLNRVTWRKTGTMADSVAILLVRFDCRTLISTLLSSTSNDGSERVAIPGGLTPGIYMIKVSTVDNAVMACSEPFNIARSPFYITDPPAGSIWRPGGTYTVFWTTTERRDINISILLRRPGEMVGFRYLKDNTQNDGSETLTIPANIGNGNYMIEIMPWSGSWSGQQFCSEIFTISSLR